MRILAYLYYPFFNQHLSGGLQVEVRTLIRGFIERGHQVRVLCPASDSRPLLEAPGLEVIPNLREQRTDPMPPEDVSHNLRQIRVACEGRDLVWSLDRLFPAEVPQPIVLCVSAICYANELDALFGLNWDHLVVPSDYVARTVDAWLPQRVGRFDRRRRSSIGSPVEPIFRPTVDTSGLRSKLGLRGDSRYLLFPHRPEAGKCHELALRVLKVLHAHDPRFHLLVPKPAISRMMDRAPEDDYVRQIEAEAKRLALRLHVTFHDWIDYQDLPAYYSLGDCCLYLSQLPETFGLALVQSIACGTFVVSSGAGALKETVPPGHGHAVVPDLEPGTIARAVLAGCSDEDVRRGRSLVMERYGSDSIVDAYLDCFSKAMNALPLRKTENGRPAAKSLKRAAARRLGYSA